MLKKVIILLLLIGVLAGAYGYFFMYHKSHPDFESLEADLSISASELFYQCRDEAKALAFTGKIIELTGIPQELETNNELMTLVFILDEGLFGAEGVRVTFLPKHNIELEELEMNTQVKLKAFCAGYNDTDVILEKASFIKK